MARCRFRVVPANRPGPLRLARGRDTSGMPGRASRRSMCPAPASLGDMRGDRPCAKPGESSRLEGVLPEPAPAIGARGLRARANAGPVVCGGAYAVGAGAICDLRAELGHGCGPWGFALPGLGPLGGMRSE